MIDDLKKMEGKEIPKGKPIDLNEFNPTAWYIVYKT